jgi:hypothetical protein
MAEALSEKRLLIPDNLPMRPTLLIIGFTMASRKEAAVWSQEMRKLQEGLGISIFDIAVIDDAPRLVRGNIKRNLKKNIPESIHDSFLIVSEGSDSLRNLVQYDASDKAFILLLDKDGSVLWNGSGIFNDKIVRVISRIIDGAKEASNDS